MAIWSLTTSVCRFSSILLAVCLCGSSTVEKWLRLPVVSFWVARRSQTSRGLPVDWILPYLSTLGVGALKLFVGFIFCVSRGAGWSSVWAWLKYLFDVSLPVVGILCAEWGEIALDCFPVSSGLVGVMCGEPAIRDFDSSVEGLMNLGHGSADGGGDLRKAEAGPAYGRWVGCSL